MVHLHVVWLLCPQFPEHKKNFKCKKSILYLPNHTSKIKKNYLLILLMFYLDILFSLAIVQSSLLPWLCSGRESPTRFPVDFRVVIVAKHFLTLHRQLVVYCLSLLFTYLYRLLSVISGDPFLDIDACSSNDILLESNLQDFNVLIWRISF